VDIVRDALLSDLPAGFAAAEQIVLGMLDDPRFDGWMVWPATELVVARALETGSVKDYDRAMALLARLTVRLTGEFAVRDLLVARPERGLALMRTLAEHDDEHVRRFASEGSRAYLPWAKRVPWLLSHARATRGILDAIYRDPAEYVRRSVANHLNDLSRVDPAVVIETATDWATHPDANTPRVLRHGLRTLVKRGDSGALALVGFEGDSLRVADPRLSSEIVPFGGAVQFTTEVTNYGTEVATVAIDYSIGFRRADGSVHPKTFKVGSRRILPGGSVAVTKAHSFRPITTRTYYPGRHFVTVQANGVLSSPTDFVLEEARTSSGETLPASDVDANEQPHA
jgi:3-methyladenine DNA glycosylase AlkC